MGVQVKELSNDSGRLVKHKARLVGKDFGQKKRIYFEQIFSPVVKMTTVRVVMGLATSMDLKLAQTDVKSMFLHDDFNE